MLKIFQEETVMNSKACHGKNKGICQFKACLCDTQVFSKTLNGNLSKVF